jgi:hypothetical protein
MPQYDFTYPRTELTSNFIQDSLQRLQQGEAPGYYANAAPRIGSELSGSAVNRYYTGGGYNYGDLGDTSIKGDIGAAQALTGASGRSFESGYNPWNQEYANRSLGIGDKLTKMGVNESGKASEFMPKLSNSMARGPESRWVTYTPTKKKFNSGEKITYNVNYGPVTTQRGNLSGVGKNWFNNVF